MALPEPREVLINYGLYDRIEISQNDDENFFNLMYCTSRIDFFCPSCQKNSTFEGMSGHFDPEGNRIESYSFMKENYNDFYIEDLIRHVNHLFVVRFECTRNRNHKAQFQFYKIDEFLMKIGQYPSIAELSNEKIKKYRKILTSKEYKELNRGIGLFSHGVGIGAFVYLRRIFENLIYETYENKKIEMSSDEKNFFSLKMNEKIQALRDYLPNTLFETKEIYGILSKGIHELSEQECLEYFPVVQIAIELILDEKYENKIRTEKEKSIKSEISKIKNRLKTR